MTTGRGPLYDRIGRGYATRRRADPRIAHAIISALGDAASVVNVGAGTGSYEPAGRTAVAVEPSPVMLEQRSADSAPAVRAVAEALPFGDAAFDAAMAVLTLHHWADPARGLAELRRVARRRVVILTWLPDAAPFWLTDDYFPEIVARDRGIFPSLGDLEEALGTLAVTAVPVPHDCTDGFLGAFWRRPEAYLDEDVRAGISGFGALADLASGLARLASDLSTGRWHRRHADLSARDALDLGYRLVVASAHGAVAS